MLEAFDKVIWKDDRAILNDLIFALQLSRDVDSVKAELDHACFVLYKPRELVEQYKTILELYKGARFKNILEIGIWNGGSLAFWNELLEPDKIVGVDIVSECPSPYFTEYASDDLRCSRIATFWGVDQGDGEKLDSIARTNFDGALDLIIDDGSHFYEETRSSFSTLFKYLKSGGVYVIEDWQWSYWEEFQHHEYFEGKTDLSLFIKELIRDREKVGIEAIVIQSRMVALKKR